MAQFLILELAPLLEGLHFVKMGPNAERRPASDLRAELPEKPYGLGLL
jgi:hypothetical protein